MATHGPDRDDCMCKWADRLLLVASCHSHGNLRLSLTNIPVQGMHSGETREMCKSNYRVRNAHFSRLRLCRVTRFNKSIIDRSINQSTNTSINQPINHSINPAISPTINESVRQSINRSSNHPIIQSINPPINNSSYFRFFLSVWLRLRESSLQQLSTIITIVISHHLSFSFFSFLLPSSSNLIKNHHHRIVSI